MCGIVSVLQDDPAREPPALADVVAKLESAYEQLPFVAGAADLVTRIGACAEAVEAADTLLRGVPGVLCLSGDPSSTVLLGTQLDALLKGAESLESALDAPQTGTDEALERINAGVVRLKDAIWAVRRDRLRTADATVDLAGRDASPTALRAFAQIQIALAAIDRLEVRGRDSAGVVVVVRDHGVDIDSPAIRDLWAQRSTDPLFRSTSVREESGNLCFVYKAAAEIGELGDNTKAIRDAMRTDPLLHLAVAGDRSRAVVLGHTRWASVGMISEANAHPLNSEEPGRDGPLVVAALNGDIDNHADLRVAERVQVPIEITTDAKIIPVLGSRSRAEGFDVEEAFRRTVSSFEGSVAIAAVGVADPDRVLLALRGSGQALYVGLAEDAFIVASEPYGLVEQCTSYLRMDGELPADPADPTTRGQIVVLSDDGAGDAGRIRRIAYNGTELPVTADEWQRPQITTRDVDRGMYPHFLLKEIEESPRSFRKT
ncbi:MAG: SIS domain-containing protein, partial [Actinomycetota bacterium]